MVTASHAHDDHDHNLFIDNYVHNEILPDNETEKYRGRFNYHKIQSGPSNELNADYADYIYKLIMESLKI